MMTCNSNGKLGRREFLKKSTVAAAAFATGFGVKPAYAVRRKTSAGRKKVIVIGIDGMDPRLSERMMKAGKLPNFDKLRKLGGYRVLGTSIPPLSPVAWANFINGAGPGSHGIFDFIHRNPEKQCAPFFGMAEPVAGDGYWEVGDYKIQLDFWPFNHKPPATLLRRQGTPFWDYLDQVGIYSTFYDLPSNYPPSPSKYGHHRCLSGLGTPDMLGGYGTYQHFAEDGPIRTKHESGGMRSMLFFEDDSAKAKLTGPQNTFLRNSKPVTIDFTVHRDKLADAAVIEIQKHKIVLKKGQWSNWYKLDFELTTPAFMPNKNISGICRFYLQEVSPNFRLYVSPINADPSDSSLKITEPSKFIEEISNKLGLFPTIGMQEAYNATKNNVFTDDEYAKQAGIVLEERINLLNYALENYDDGLLFFYFSSTDLQAHMFWWDTDEEHPTRSRAAVKKNFSHLKGIYRKLDSVLGDILKRYGEQATIIVMSDHGFGNWKRQFNLNTWLRDNGYLHPPDSTSIMSDVDWSKTKAYALGVNALYLNLQWREQHGVVSPGRQQEELTQELITKLEALHDSNGRQVIRKVHRTDRAYSGPATALAPDFIIGYRRGYGGSWGMRLGGMSKEILSDNDSPWSADHCADVSEVPGVIFSNRPIGASAPSLVDVAPSILTEFGLKVPSSMEGKNIFAT